MFLLTLRTIFFLCFLLSVFPFSQICTVDYQVNFNRKVDARLSRVWITLYEWEAGGLGGARVSQHVCLGSGRFDVHWTPGFYLPCSSLSSLHIWKLSYS